MFNPPPRTSEVYCDITTPARWESDDTVHLIDLDLDVVRRRATGLVELLDEDEFAEHRARFGYPDDVVAEARGRGTAAVRGPGRRHRAVRHRVPQVVGPGGLTPRGARRAERRRVGDDPCMSAPRQLQIVAPDGGSVRELLRVTAPVDLGAIDPRSTPGLPEPAGRGEHRKTWAREQVELVGEELGRQQEMLFAMARTGSERPAHRVLLVLQAMDCGGKDGTIKRVAGAMNPLGLHIRSFGPPTRQELRHDFLWRIRRELPPPGYVGMFNRSHYEDVLIARVASLVPEATWRARYDEINAFERELAEGGVTLIKVMLHISYDEQGKRLLGRLHRPAQALEVQPRRHRLAGPLGRLPGRVRRGPEPVRHGRRALVRGAGGPQVVPGLGGGPPAA